MFPQIPFGYLNNIQIKEGRSVINLSNVNILSYIRNVKDLEINTSINQVVSDSKVSLLNYADSDLDLSNISIKTTTQEYKQILSSLTLSPITIDSILTGEPLTDFGAFMEISTNTILSSNTPYITTTSGCVHTFPATPSIGDVIQMATGNFDTRINHGNASQQVRNLSTLTTSGIDSGVILKPYSVCQFIYVGGNLWITGYRARTINNWLGAAYEETASQKTYTATEAESYTYFSSYGLSKINDGNTTDGVMKTGGGTFGELQVICTFSVPTILTAYTTNGGQFNGAFNLPQTLDVYIGSSKSGTKIQDNATYVSNTAFQNSITTVPTDGSLDYLFVFKRSADNNLSICELTLIGRGALTGGEIVAT